MIDNIVLKSIAKTTQTTTFKLNDLTLLHVLVCYTTNATSLIYNAHTTSQIHSWMSRKTTSYKCVCMCAVHAQYLSL